MALQTSGAISLNEIHVEVGGTSASAASINDTDIIGMIGKTAGAEMSFSEWYGASSGYAPSGLGVAFNSSILNSQAGPYGNAFYHPDANTGWASISLYQFNANSASNVTFDTDVNSSVSIGGKNKSSSAGGGDIIAVDGKHVLSTCNDGTLVCRDASNSGAVLWQKKVSGISACPTSDGTHHASAVGHIYQKTHGKDFDHVTRESGIYLSGTLFAGFTTSSGWYAVAFNSSTGAVKYSFLLASNYRGQWMDYDSTHVQLCAYNGGGGFYNILVNKSTGATSSQVKGATGKAQLRGFRTSYGAWIFMQHNRDHGGKDNGGGFGIRNASGGVVGGCSFGQNHNGHPRGIITPGGRIAMIAGQGGILNVGPRACFTVWSAAATPSVAYCRDFRTSSGGSLAISSFLHGVVNLPDNHIGVITSTCAGIPGSGTHAHRIGIAEIDCDSTPTSGTYGPLYLQTATFSFGQSSISGSNLPNGKHGPTGLSGSGNSFSFVTAELGSSNPSSNSDSIYSVATPTLNTDTGSLSNRAMSVSSKSNTSGGW